MSSLFWCLSQCFKFVRPSRVKIYVFDVTVIENWIWSFQVNWMINSIQNTNMQNTKIEVLFTPINFNVLECIIIWCCFTKYKVNFHRPRFHPPWSVVFVRSVCLLSLQIIFQSVIIVNLWWSMGCFVKMPHLCYI